jgi:hypothetical protein
VSLIAKACAVECILLDRVGYESGNGSTEGKFCRLFNSCDDLWRSFSQDRAGFRVSGKRPVENRERVRKHTARLPGRADFPYRQLRVASLPVSRIT